MLQVRRGGGRRKRLWRRRTTAWRATACGGSPATNSSFPAVVWLPGATDLGCRGEEWPRPSQPLQERHSTLRAAIPRAACVVTKIVPGTGYLTPCFARPRFWRSRPGSGWKLSSGATCSPTCGPEPLATAQAQFGATLRSSEGLLRYEPTPPKQPLRLRRPEARARRPGGPDVTLTRLQVPVKCRDGDAVGRDRS